MAQVHDTTCVRVGEESIRRLWEARAFPSLDTRPAQIIERLSAEFGISELPSKPLDFLESTMGLEPSTAFVTVLSDRGHPLRPLT